MADIDLATLPPEEFWEGIRQFNQGEYYACHDTLEAVWMAAPQADRPFYQGILQFAVALYHLGNHNWQGAVILLGEGMNRLQAFEPTYYGVAVTALVDCGLAWLQVLQALGPEQVVTAAAAIAPGSPTPITLLNQTLPPLRIDADALDAPSEHL